MNDQWLVAELTYPNQVQHSLENGEADLNLIYVISLRDTSACNIVVQLWAKYQ